MRWIGVSVAIAGCGFQPTQSSSDAHMPDGMVDAAPDGNPANARRKPITIHGAQVTGSLADFPVWIDLVDAQIGARAQADGSDIFFTRSDGTPLAHELRRYTSGHVQAWVRVPQLDHNVDTTIYIRYGETGGPQSIPAQVFSSSFMAVWHLDDALTGTTVADALGTHTGTAIGGLGPSSQIAGKLGGGIDFDGNANEIQFTNTLAGGGAHTISAWVSARTAVSFDTILVLGNATGNQSRWLHAHYYTNAVAAGFYGNDWDNAGTNIDNAGWTLLHWVFDGNTTSRLYRDGVFVGMHDHTNGTVNTMGAGGHIGNAPMNWGAGGTVAPALAGTLDEVRIATTDRTPAWVATEFANQSAPGSFYALGAEELVP